MTPSKKGVTFDFCEICSVDAAICNVQIRVYKLTSILIIM